MTTKTRLLNTLNYARTDEILEDMAKLLRAKGENYGPSFKAISEILLILFPEGVPTQAYGDVGLMIRCLDKFCRMAFGPRAGDAPWAQLVDQECPWKDVLGYAALGVEANDG